MLTRLPVPPVATFNVFSERLPVPVHIQPLKDDIVELTPDQVRLLARYTLRLCRAVVNKMFACEESEMAYFLAPTQICEDLPADRSVVGRIAWQEVRLAADHWSQPLPAITQAEPMQDMRDVVVQNRFVEFTRRYRVVRLRRDLHPVMRPPADSPVRTFSHIFFSFVKVTYNRSAKQDTTAFLATAGPSGTGVTWNLKIPRNQ